MKKVLLLMIGAVVAFATHADVTIKVKNDANWGQVNIWAYDSGDAGKWMTDNGQSSWTGNDGKQNTWPGPKMTLNATSGYYEITFTNAPLNVSISNNGNGQKDFTNQSNVAGTIYCTSGSTEDAPDPQPVVPVAKRVKHTVYIYNKSGKNMMDLRAYVWNGDDKVSPWPGVPVSFQGKYINKDGQQYPAWEYTFYWDKSVEGAQIIFQGTGLAQSEDLPYTEGKFYYYDGAVSGDNSQIKTDDTNTYALVDRTPVPGKTTIYMHFKRDYVANADVNVPPHCHIYNGTNGAVYTSGAWQNENAHQEDMYLVNGKYQIWGYDIDTDKINQYDNVIFSFKLSGGGWRHYRTDAVPDMYTGGVHDGDRWADFIYATGNVGDKYGAVQTYMSYARFKFRDEENNPRQWAFIVGSPSMTFTPRVGENLNPVPLSWDIFNPKQAIAEDGCFYIKLTPTFPDNADKENEGDKRQLAKFKTGWINVGWAYDWATGPEGPGIPTDKDYSQRGWATFDLGIIGVNDRDTRITDGEEKKINIQTNGQNALFRTNTSVTYSNYSQYDWCLVNGIAEAGKTYYAVIDTHSECRSVTLCTFEPHPHLNVLPSTIETLTLTTDHAKGLHQYMHDNGLQLEAANANGHIIMDKVNIAKGYLQVTGADDATVYDAGFTPTYNIQLDGKDLLDHVGKPAYLQMNYLPLDEGKAFQVRATYEDNDTHITFHSLKSEGTLEADIQPKAPTGSIGRASFYLDENGHFGVWMPDVTMHVNENEYAVYGDFRFDGFSGEIVNSDHHIAKPSFFADESYLLDWTKLEDESQYDFNNYANDWSSKIISENQTLPVYLPEAVTDVTDFDELETKYKDYKVSGNVYAVYPFLYEMNPTVTVLQTLPSNSPRRAVSDSPVTPNTVTDDGIENLEDFALNKMVLAAPVAKTISGIVSGVENVEADGSEGPAEYFTVAGVRVAGEPTPGIYLRRQGTKVEKVVIR